MSKWYSILARSPLDFDNFGKAVDYFEAQYEDAKKDLIIDEKRLNTVLKEIPGLFEYRYAQLQELEAILKLYEREELKEKTARKKFYLENYNRSLTDRQADQYAEVDQTVLDLAQLVEHIALIRNKFFGIFKGLEQMGFRIGDITRLRVAGIEDAII
jgi:hypothetical protein